MPILIGMMYALIDTHLGLPEPLNAHIKYIIPLFFLYIDLLLTKGVLVSPP